MTCSHLPRGRGPGSQGADEGGLFCWSVSARCAAAAAPGSRLGRR